MKCRHFFSFVLVLFLSFFFGSFIITSDTFASSVNCGDIVSSFTDITYNSSNHSYYYSLSSCDTSSLDSSLPWFYHYSLQFSSNRSSSWSFGFLLGTAHYNSDFDSLFADGGKGSFSSFSGVSVSPSFSFGTLNPHFQNLLFKSNSQVINLSSFTLSISDSFSSSDCPVSPSGDISIISNGTYDVSSYATATVDVPAEVIQGDYHDDLVNINQSIIVCGAILLVLYFFYCIYRLIIKNSGVQ